MSEFDAPEALPLFVARAEKIYEHMTKMILKRCRVENTDEEVFAGKGVTRAVMPEMSPAEKRAFDATGFIMKTYYELRLIEKDQKVVTLEELYELTPQEQARVAEDPGQMMVIFHQRKQEAEDLAERRESNRAAESGAGGSPGSGVNNLLAAR